MVGLVATTGQHDDVVYLWLRRPRQGNALDPETVNRLHGELSAAESNPECLAVVIRAEGSNFCAGADVKASKELMNDPDRLLSFFAEGRRLMERLVSSRLVSIAVVQGLAAAGGLELVTAADIVIATDEALFADRHATYGYLPHLVQHHFYLSGLVTALPETCCWESGNSTSRQPGVSDWFIAAVRRMMLMK